MKIFYYSYPWAMHVAGGGERQMMAYRHHLARYGVEVELFDMWQPVFEPSTIFHCFAVMPGVIELCDFAKRQGMKVVVSPNLWITPETKERYPCHYIQSVFELADAIVVNSSMEIRALSGVLGVAESKFHIVYNAAEADFLVPENPLLFTERFGIKGPFVLNVANVEPRKNQLEFLEVLRAERPDLKCIVVGGIRDHDYAQACRDIAGDQLKIIDPLPYASPFLRSALHGCEFFAMPSLLETPSIAAIEAAASGCKVLLTREGSTTEYFGDSVTYVTPGSKGKMAEAIREVGRSSSEKSTWVARNGYMWPKVIPSLLDVYRSQI